MDRREAEELLKRLAGGLDDDQWMNMRGMLNHQRGLDSHPHGERVREIIDAFARESGGGSGAGRVDAHDRRLSFDALFPNTAGVRVIG